MEHFWLLLGCALLFVCFVILSGSSRAQYFVSCPDGQTRGPFELEQLGNMLASGTINPDSPCAKQGDKNWQPVSSVVPAAGSSRSATPGTSPSAAEPVNWPMVLGSILIVIGLAIAGYFFLLYDTAAPGTTTVNLSRLSDRQTGVMIGMGLAILGGVLLVAGRKPSS